MLNLWIALAAMGWACAGFLVIRLLDARTERDEAIDKYNGGYALGYTAGVQEAGAVYKARVPYADGYRAGWQAREAALAEAEGRTMEVAR